MTDPDRQLAEKWAEKLTLQYLNSAPRCIAWDAYLAGLSKGKELGRGEMKALVEAAWNVLLRLDHNGGIGEYKGGPAFVVEPLRKALKSFEVRNEG
jgi:hypothetical protein